MTPVQKSPARAPLDARRASRPDSRVSYLDVQLPLPPKQLSPNATCHWAAKARATRLYRQACWAAFQQAKPKGWTQVPIEIDVSYRCSAKAIGYAPKDIGNAISSLKAAVDAMQDAGVIPNDSKKWLAWGQVSLITRKTDPAWLANGDGVTVTIRRAWL